jgi:LmbE family N-acetylglucosaminyl deacetylase
VPIILIALVPALLWGEAPRSSAGRYAEPIAQCLKELRNPAVVLYLSLQPGYEDAAQLARYRFDEGAQVILGYVTNGEGTPSDVGDMAPNAVAGRRKEEATHAAEVIGATPFFLNAPDPGIVPDRERLLRIWNADTLSARLTRELRRYRPDVIVLVGDRRAGQVRSVRLETLRELVLAALTRAVSENAGQDSLRSGLWKVSRVLIEKDAADKRAKLRRQTADTARAMLGAYASMRLQLASAEARRAHDYDMVLPARPVLRGGHLTGVPVYGKYAARYLVHVRELAGTQARPIERPSLRSVRLAIDSLDVLLARDRSSIGTGDLRILATWKNSLEQLRCLQLGVSIDVSVDNPNVTRSQMVFLRFGKISPGDDSARTRIFFPGAANHTWGINESMESQFSLSSGREFRVISPYNLEFSYPVPLFGLDKPSLPTRFSFIVIHRSRKSDSDYVYRKEIPLHANPRRSVEVLSPIVRAGKGQPLLIRMVNSNRDAYSGSLSIDDSLFLPVTRPVSLAQRDEVHIDTLSVTPKSPLPEGDYVSAVTLSGGGRYPFVVRSFPADIPPEATIGLLTAVPDSPLAVALERLNASWHYLTPDARPGSDINVIVVDRDVFAESGMAPAITEHLQAWVKEGGHLVVFSPSAGNPLPEGLAPLAFEPGPAVPPWGQLEFDSTSIFVSAPNVVRVHDWDGWVISRAQSHIRVDAALGTRILVRSGADRSTLAAEVAVDKGLVTFVALDLMPQLMNVHPGAHRILGNLLRPAFGSGEKR